MSKIEQDASAKEIAQAMREGLESRRGLGSQPFGKLPPPSFTSDTQHALSVHADLLSLPPMARAGLFSSAVRAARRVLRSFLRPWLAVQSRYNRLALDALQALAGEINVLAARINDLEASRATESLQITTSSPARTSDNHSTTAKAVVCESSLRYIFVLGHLPAPPARLLLAGEASRGMARELETLGYEIYTAEPPGMIASERSAVLADFTSLPFSDGFFDCVVWSNAPRPMTEQSVDYASVQGWNALDGEARRVLRPHGTLIADVALDHEERDDSPLDAFLPSFRRIRTVFYSREAESCLSTGLVRTELSAVQGTLVFVLVAAERR
jgi:SAM-dependent methyltransferase